MSTTLPGNVPADDPFLRLPEVAVQSGLSKTTIYRLIKTGDFPAPKRIGPRASAWLSSTVTHWKASRPDAREQQAA
jgi:prophage regulatory protein